MTDARVEAAGARTRSHPTTTWDAAYRLAHRIGAGAPVAPADVSLTAALGRILTAPLSARTAIPAFARSAMDGWAVAGEPPWTVGAPIDASTAPELAPLSPGTARPICTGAPAPPGSGVLRSEHGHVVDRDGAPELERMRDARPDEPRPGEHVRPSGEEAAAGEHLIAAGARLTPPRVALAAAAGHDRLLVAGTPTVDLLVLGDELVPTGTPADGAVRDVVSPAFPVVVEALGGRMLGSARVADDRAATTAAFERCQADLLVVTGGSSRGRTDHARAAAAALGVRLAVDGVAMRPGHPVMFGVRPDGRPVLLLPGNPFAAFLTLLSFGGPLLAGMAGIPRAALADAELAAALPDGGGDTRLVAVGIGPGGARAVPHQGSGMLRGLAGADAIAVVRPGTGRAGSAVPVLPLPW